MTDLPSFRNTLVPWIGFIFYTLAHIFIQSFFHTQSFTHFTLIWEFILKNAERILLAVKKSANLEPVGITGGE